MNLRLWTSWHPSYACFTTIGANVRSLDKISDMSESLVNLCFVTQLGKSLPRIHNKCAPKPWYPQVYCTRKPITIESWVPNNGGWDCLDNRQRQLIGLSNGCISLIVINIGAAGRSSGYEWSGGNYTLIITPQGQSIPCQLILTHQLTGTCMVSLPRPIRARQASDSAVVSVYKPLTSNGVHHSGFYCLTSQYTYNLLISISTCLWLYLNLQESAENCLSRTCDISENIVFLWWQLLFENILWRIFYLIARRCRLTWMVLGAGRWPPLARMEPTTHSGHTVMRVPSHRRCLTSRAPCQAACRHRLSERASRHSRPTAAPTTRWQHQRTRWTQHSRTAHTSTWTCWTALMSIWSSPPSSGRNPDHTAMVIASSTISIQFPACTPPIPAAPARVSLWITAVWTSVMTLTWPCVVSDHHVTAKRTLPSWPATRVPRWTKR